MVAPAKFEEFIQLMNLTKIQNELFIDNVQSMIDHENSAAPLNGEFGWTRYHTLNEINAFLDDLSKKYPNNVEVIIGGKSYEGREIKGVKLRFAAAEKPGVFIEGGIHAREWISPATVTYILNQLLSSNDPNVREMAERHDWYIFPSFNPDGYEYTHTTVSNI